LWWWFMIEDRPVRLALDHVDVRIVPGVRHWTGVEAVWERGVDASPGGGVDG